MKNEFITDAEFFLKKAAAIVKADMAKDAIVDAILNFALGAERLLKGILFDINPVYVYKTQDFKNTIAVLYKSRLLPSANHNNEISGNPDEDVLTFKLSLRRAKAISLTTEKHTSLLFALSNWRDIIAHNLLSKLNIEKCRTLLLRDFYALISDFSAELKVPITKFLGPHDIRLASVSADHQESVEAKVTAKLEAQRKKWEQQRKMSGYEPKMKQKTELMLKSYASRKDSFTDLVSCPACDNVSLLTARIDYDYSDGHVSPTGAFVTNLRCLFCKLVIDDYDEIDYLGLNAMLTHEDHIEE